MLGQVNITHAATTNQRTQVILTKLSGFELLRNAKYATWATPTTRNDRPDQHRQDLIREVGHARIMSFLTQRIGTDHPNGEQNGCNCHRGRSQPTPFAIGSVQEKHR